MIIDAHHHYADESYYTDYHDYAADLVRAMDRYGWDWVCLNAYKVPDLAPEFSNDNRLVAEAVERYPRRIIGIGWIDMDKQTPAMIKHLHDMGMRGLKIIATLKRYDDDAYLPFYEEAAALSMPILFHTGQLGGTTLLKPMDVSSDRYRPITLDRLARLFPGLVIIGAHLGLPWFEETLGMMDIHPNLYFDLTGRCSELSPEYYTLPRYSVIRWERLLFGSDSLANDGHIAFTQIKHLMNALAVDPQTQQKVLGETAAKIYRIV